MFKNYLKVAVRNLIATRLPRFINVGDLQQAWL
jgi:hypothetical protein